MKTIGQRIAAQMFALCLLALASGASAQTAAVAEQPTFKVGDSWRYRAQDVGNRRDPTWFVNTVAELKDKNAMVFGEDSGARKYWWVYDQQQAKFLKRLAYSDAASDKLGDMTLDISNAEPPYRFPLQVGTKWEFREQWADRGSKGTTEFKVEVSAQEKVKTEAGEFDVFRIEYTGWWRDSNGYTGKRVVNRWYSPAVKRHVKYELKSWTSNGQLWDHRTEELLEYRPGS